jgi:ribosomal protein L40E
MTPDERLKICPSCGAEAEINAPVCQHCGHQFTTHFPPQEDQIKICPSCGDDTDINATVCKRCGHQFTTQFEPTGEPPIVPPIEASQPHLTDYAQPNNPPVPGGPYPPIPDSEQTTEPPLVEYPQLGNVQPRKPFNPVWIVVGVCVFLCIFISIAGSLSGTNNIDYSTQTDNPKVVAVAKKIHKHDAKRTVDILAKVVPRVFTDPGGTKLVDVDSRTNRITQTYFYDVVPESTPGAKDGTLIVSYYTDDWTVNMTQPDPNYTAFAK